MTDLERIKQLFTETDKQLESLRSSTKLSQCQIDNRQVINDQVYFVLAWGQFEAEVEEACKAVIRCGQSNDDWGIRRVWALFNTQNNPGLTFQEQLSLVLEENSSDWNLVLGYYDLRNQIARGDIRPSRIFPSVFNDLLRIQKSLVRA